jgi:transposase
MLLGLDAAWKVADVKLELDTKQVVIRPEHIGRQVTCLECCVACSCHDFAPERTWRHLDTLQFEIALAARVPRANCKACGVKTYTMPWAGKHSLLTCLFDAFAIEALKASRCVEAARKVLRLLWASTHKIIKRGV